MITILNTYSKFDWFMLIENTIIKKLSKISTEQTNKKCHCSLEKNFYIQYIINQVLAEQYQVHAFRHFEQM